MGGHDPKTNGVNGGGPTSSSSASSSRCCRSSWTWVLYVLVLSSFAASIMVFWMTLYKQQELQMRLLSLEEERNRTLQEMVGKQMSQLKWLAMKNERVGEEHAVKIDELTGRLDRREQFDQQELRRREGEVKSWAEARVRDAARTQNVVINRLNKKVSDWETANVATLKALNRFKASLEETREEGREGARQMQQIREEMDEMWTTLDGEGSGGGGGRAAGGGGLDRGGGKSVDDERAHIIEIQTLRDEFASALAASEEATDARLSEVAEEAAAGRAGLSLAMEGGMDLLRRDLVQLDENVTSALESLAEDSDERWRQQAKAQIKFRQEDADWKENALLEMRLMNSSHVQRMDATSRAFSDQLAAVVEAMAANRSQEDDDPDPTAAPSPPSPPSPSTTAAGIAASFLLEEVSTLRQQVSALDSKFSQGMALAEVQLDALEEFSRVELAGEVDRNADGLEQLLKKVKHFLRTLNKVKDLPAEVHSLDMRLEAMDANLARMASAAGDGDELRAELEAIANAEQEFNATTTTTTVFN